MERGAVDVAAKPQNLSGDEYEVAAKQLRRLVRALSGVPRVHLRRARAKLHGTIAELSSLQPKPTFAHEARPRVVLIGASTGGPPLVADLLHAIPRPVSIPVLIAQHMSAGFGEGFASWLTDCTKHATAVVKGNTKLIASVYLAPDSQSLRLLSSATLAPSPVTNAAGTSIDELFASAAEIFGPSVLAFLLTGMGKDGAAGLKKIRDAGGKTVAQEPKTCAVDSMPRSAIELAAASAIMTPEQMGELLRQTMAARLPAS